MRGAVERVDSGRVMSAVIYSEMILMHGEIGEFNEAHYVECLA